MNSNDHLSRYQDSLLDSVRQENNKFEECLKSFDIESEIAKARLYHHKLVNIKREMTVTKERSLKLKARALKLQEEKQKTALDQELKKDRIKQREKQLSPVVRSSSSGSKRGSPSSSGSKGRSPSSSGSKRGSSSLEQSTSSK